MIHARCHEHRVMPITVLDIPVNAHVLNQILHRLHLRSMEHTETAGEGAQEGLQGYRDRDEENDGAS